MDVILSANITHYYYTALALQKAGYLQLYICTIGLRKQNQWLLQYLPNHWRKKLQGRTLAGLEPNQIKMLWLPEFIQRSLPKLKLVSLDQANWLHDRFYDWLASHWVTTCDIFHFVNPVGLYCAQQVKARGGILICDVRTEFPPYQYQILADEAKRLGITFQPPGRLNEARALAEYQLADYLIVPSNYAKRTFVEAGYDKQKIFVLPYGVDLRQFSLSTDDDTQKQKTDSTFRILYAGQIILRKGIHILIEAFEGLPIEDTELILVGRVDETMQSVLKVATQRNPRIRVTGNVSKQDLQQYYNLSNVFVMPSLADSWGLVVSEAMACKLPIIVTENSGSHEAVRNGIDGFIIPIRDAEILKNKLLCLYKNPELCQQMGQAAYDRIRDFTWERYGNQLLEIYAEILQRNKAVMYD